MEMINFGNEIDRLKEYIGYTVSEGKKIDKKSLKVILKELKTDINLKTQYVIYENIKSFSSEDSDEINEHIASNTQLVNRLNRKKLSESNTKLKSLVDAVVKDVNISIDTNPINESIHSLIVVKPTPTNTKERAKAKKFIVEAIKSAVPLTVSDNKEYTDPKFLSSVLIERFNSKYEDADPTTRQIFTNHINNNEEANRILLKSLVSECVKLVNDNLTTEDVERRAKFLSVKEGLLNIEYSKDSIISEAQRLTALKDSLKYKVA